MARLSKSQLEKLQKKLITDDAIGKLFGITRQAVHQLRIKYQIAPIDNKHSERNEDILKQYNQGISGTKLSKKFKLSISQTYRIINELQGKENPVKKTVKKVTKKAK
jgi:hypothetical protein